MTDETGACDIAPTRLEIGFEAVHPAGINHQAANELLQLTATRKDESLLEGDVLVITKSRPSQKEKSQKWMQTFAAFPAMKEQTT